MLADWARKDKLINKRMNVTTNSETEKLIQDIGGMQIVDLSHTIEEAMPVYPTHPQYFHMKWHTGDPANLYQLLISEHAGTHLDSPSHFYGEPDNPHRIDLDTLPIQSFIGRAIKLDFPGMSGETQLSARDILAWENENFSLRSGDAAVFNFSWEKKWAKLPKGNEFLANWPGLNKDAAQCLASRGIRMAATDCLGIDGSSTADLGSHFEFLEKKILIVENLANLSLVPQVFLLITLPLKIKRWHWKPNTGSSIVCFEIFIILKTHQNNKFNEMVPYIHVEDKGLVKLSC